MNRDTVRQAPPRPRLPILGTVSAHVMVRTAGEHGLTKERCLRGTGIAPEVLEDVLGTIRLEQELALARNLVRELPEVPALGLRLSDRYRLSLYGIVGWGMLCSATVGEALAFTDRYLDLTYACCALSAGEEAGEFRVAINGRRLPEDVRDFFVDRSVGSVVRLLGDLLSGDEWLRGVEMVMPRPAHASLYEEVLGVPVRFGRPANLIRIAGQALALPMPMANELMLRHVEQQCRELLAERRAQLTLADQVREYALQRMPDLPGMSGAAGALGLSERTLRRRLADSGTSFSDIVSSARRALAEELLLQGVPPVQVARRVGFAGPAAFTHAFKRWTGSSPGAFAAQPVPVERGTGSRRMRRPPAAAGRPR